MSVGSYLMRRVSLRMKPLLLLLLFLQPKRGREVAGSRRRLLLRGSEVARCPTVTQTARVRIHRATVLPSPRSLQTQKCCWSRKDLFGVGGEDEGGDVLRTGTVPAAAAAVPTAAAAAGAASLLPLSNGA